MNLAFPVLTLQLPGDPDWHVRGVGGPAAAVVRLEKQLEWSPSPWLSEAVFSSEI